MKRRLKELAILALAIGVVGVITLVSGVVPIGASGGHWKVTRIMLDFASDRSVDFHSSGIEVPSLSEPGMMRLGAATYEANCRWCHGRPGLPAPVVAKNMTPTPPFLPNSELGQQPRELFYIVKHGIKFAGMPAWPSQQHDDEIWPLVVFLKSLPEMSAATYASHIEPSTEMDFDARHFVAERCAACHGIDGNVGAGDRVPTLSGQSQAYLVSTLQAYKSGRRQSGIMHPIAARLSNDRIRSVSAHFSESQRRKADSSVDQPELLEFGRQLAEEGDGERKIAACRECHGPGPILRSDEYPKLAGQPARYLRKQLASFADGSRGGTENANLMHPIADKLSSEEIDALSHYYSRTQAK